MYRYVKSECTEERHNCSSKGFLKIEVKLHKQLCRSLAPVVEQARKAFEVKERSRRFFREKLYLSSRNVGRNTSLKAQTRMWAIRLIELINGEAKNRKGFALW